MNDGFVSVVVPTYNRAYCICRTIDSVREQTHHHWELLIVDDGSTDGTAALIASTYGDDPRIRYLYQRSAGVSAARNAGIRESKGDFVALLDSDDVWKPWKLEAQLACFRAIPAIGMVWTNFEAVNKAGTVVNPRYLTTMYEAYRFFQPFEKLFGNSCALSSLTGSVNSLEPGARVYSGNIYPQMLRGNLVHTSTVMLSRERIAKVKEFDESLYLSGEDYDFHFRTCKWGDVCFVDASSTKYQIDFDDRLTRYKKELAQNFLKTVEKAIARERGNEIFSQPIIHQVLAEAHAWIAEELLKIEDYAGVRKHALRALGHRIWQPRMVLVLGIALLPRIVSKALLRTFRSGKAMVSGRKRP
jgi:glycosyltransferase involved in cell wall biosynthesis